MSLAASTSGGDVFAAKPPALPPAAAERIAAELFGVAGRASPLPSERDQNFRLVGADGAAWVLKLANPAEDPGVVGLEIEALRHVAACDPALPVPRVAAAAGAALSQPVELGDGRRSIARLVSFLPGSPLAAAPRAPGLAREIGLTCARLGRSLRGFFHPCAGRRLLWDLRRAPELVERVRLVEAPARRRAAAAGLERFVARALPHLGALRAQVIHNDLSRSNTLVDASGRRVTGVIDFGDLVHAPLAQDVAVALCELLLDADDPVAAAREFLAGYEEAEPLRAEERALLFDLVTARAAMALAISAWRSREHPENREYIAGDDDRTATLLERLPAIERAWRAAIEERAVRAPRAGAADDPAGEDPTLPSLLARRERALGPALSHFYERPLHLVRGEGVWVRDAAGRVYLDAYNNVPHVGHAHPQVVAAIASQAARLNTNTRYVHERVVEYAERLAATLPAGLEVCLFVCSGSEANDLAWRLARAYTRQAGALVVAGAYHGSTEATHALSPGQLPPGASAAPHVREIAAPDEYRGPHRRGDPQRALRYAASADAAITSLRARGLAPAAFFVDPVLSSSGILVPPVAGWLAAVFEKVRAAGGLCVADEVQSGFGRTGEAFWGFELHGVVPDVVTLGKPIGNGHPLACAVTRPEIARSLVAEGGFFSTFGGNPVSCAAGLAVLDAIEREGLRERARRVGLGLREGLLRLAARHAAIGDVRGAGLFLGVELVRDRATREPATELARSVLERMRESGVLIGCDGPFANVLKIRPPLVFEEPHAERLLAALDAALA